MTNCIYEERYGLKIIPVYERKKPTGFQVVQTSTKETVYESNMLSEAEDYVFSQSSPLGKGIVVGSAAEYKIY